MFVRGCWVGKGVDSAVMSTPLNMSRETCIQLPILILCSVSPKFLFNFQAGEFFYSAQRSAAAQQTELGADQSGETSLESPLLEQVKYRFRNNNILPLPCFSSFSLPDILLVLFTGCVHRCIETSETWFFEWSCAKGKGNGF
jgi:hypothetical protein